MAHNKCGDQLRVLEPELQAWYSLVCPRRRRQRSPDWKLVKDLYMHYLSTHPDLSSSSLPDDLFGFPVGGKVYIP